MPTPRVFQPAQPGCIEVVFRFVLFGLPLVIVINVCLDSGAAPSLSELTAVANACDAWMEFDLMSVLSQDLAFVQTTATDISIETGRQVVVNHGSGVLGSIVFYSLPSQIASVVSLYTVLRGKSYRGRTYIPGIPANYQTAESNTMATGDVAAVLSEYNALTSRLAPVLAKQAVLSRKHGGVKRLIAVGTPVTSRTMQNTFETQRRRGASAHR